jgi:hypothetical protein
MCICCIFYFIGNGYVTRFFCAIHLSFGSVDLVINLTTLSKPHRLMRNDKLIANCDLEKTRMQVTVAFGVKLFLIGAEENKDKTLLIGGIRSCSCLIVGVLNPPDLCFAGSIHFNIVTTSHWNFYTRATCCGYHRTALSQITFIYNLSEPCFPALIYDLRLVVLVYVVTKYFASSS